jgi:DNA-binding LacI/PurR family transcriptional regulator
VQTGLNPSSIDQERRWDVPRVSTSKAKTTGRRPTISDVATLAGTSKGTVSFVLNGRPGVAPATRDRILAAIEELGFEPNQVARSLSNSRAGVIGLVLARSPQTLRADSFFAPFIAGVEYGIAKADTSLLLRFVEDDESERAAYRKLAMGRQADGVILSDLRRDDPRLALLAELSLPAVTLNQPDVLSPFLAVCNDDTTGIDEAARHLVELGHRRIAHVSGPLKYLHAGLRDAAWRTALASHGVELAASIPGDFTADGGAGASQRLFDAEPHVRPTAIAYDNDTMAIAGVKVARSLGLRVPDDVSIIGFDDAEFAAHVSPALTTIRTDPFAWGESAARALLDVINGDAEASAIKAGESVLVRRDSTAVAPS